MTTRLRIGTRGSNLALWQANWVKSEIEHAFPGLSVDITIIKTTGDRIVDRPLSMVGGKGLFVKEIENALADKTIDLAVHSMKDMPGELPPGLIIGAVPVRENPLDVLITKTGCRLSELPSGSVIGTSSLRRASQLRHARPDIRTESIRGNLDTRLRKLGAGEFDAIVLAAAGLKRLGMESHITEYLDPAIMLPAVGQGALCIESREDDTATAAILKAIDDTATHTVVDGERAFLKRLEGSCHIPVACHGILENGVVTLTGLVASENGDTVIRESMTGDAATSQTVGSDLAELLLARGGKTILENLNI